LPSITPSGPKRQRPVAEIIHPYVILVTSGLNFTQNHRFEFAVAAAAGAVD
jgi:hypothetical protein